MATVNVRTLPDAYLKITPLYRPRPGPIFLNGDPTPEDVELARELFMALDTESKHWYRGYDCFVDLMPPPD